MLGLKLMMAVMMAGLMVEMKVGLKAGMKDVVMTDQPIGDSIRRREA